MQPKTQFYLTNIVGIIVLVFARFGLSLTTDQQESLLWLLGTIGTVLNIALAWLNSRQPPADSTPSSKQAGMIADRLAWALGVGMVALLVLVALSPLAAHAITPPPPVAPSLAKVLYSWDHPTTRTDGTALTVSEIKETRLYITSLQAYIAVPAPANSYTYIVPSGQCIAKTDAAAATAVDTGNLESAASNVAMVAVDACSKALPGKPGNVKAMVQ